MLTFRMLIHEAPCFSISRASVVHSRLHPCARGVSGYTCSAFRSASLVIHFRCTVPCHDALDHHGSALRRDMLVASMLVNSLVSTSGAVQVLERKKKHSADGTGFS
jgi:hypothetical protein